MGSALLAGSIITAVIAGGAATAKAVKSAKDRRERGKKAGNLQEQISQTQGNYESYRGEAEKQRLQGMHASMSMYGPVFDQMEAMYGEGGYQRPDFAAAMRVNESRKDPSRDIREIKGPKTNAAEEKGSKVGADGYTYDTSGTSSRADIESSRGGGPYKMDKTGTKTGQDIEESRGGGGSSTTYNTGNKTGGFGGG